MSLTWEKDDSYRDGDLIIKAAFCKPYGTKRSVLRFIEDNMPVDNDDCDYDCFIAIYSSKISSKTLKEGILEVADFELIENKNE